ncbi:hypothetical protein [Spiroplasma endosymbiont of Nebria brevicollis]|uniref:hypothetical protein n=1 Tax=Spiroplasma endosymbiont of Nebria brevicollis TaxID=3066284 RepID=UPI00313CC341
MRKLLSLLTVLTLTTPVPLNVMACGWNKTPPVVDETDYLTLAATAKEKIINSNFLRQISDHVMTGMQLRIFDNGPNIFNSNNKSEVISALKKHGESGMNVQNQTFERYLDSWQSKSLIPAQDLSSVSLTSEYKINAWSYDNLTLLPITIPTVIVENQSRIKKIDDVADKYATIFMNNGTLSRKLFIADNGSFRLTMNKTEFENYKNNNNTFGDVISYANDKIKKLAINENVLTTNDFFQTYNTYAGGKSCWCKFYKSNFKSTFERWKCF